MKFPILLLISILTTGCIASGFPPFQCYPNTYQRICQFECGCKCYKTDFYCHRTTDYCPEELFEKCFRECSCTGRRPPPGNWKDNKTSNPWEGNPGGGYNGSSGGFNGTSGGFNGTSGGKNGTSSGYNGTSGRRSGNPRRQRNWLSLSSSSSSSNQYDAEKDNGYNAHYSDPVFTTFANSVIAYSFIAYAAHVCFDKC